MSLPDLTPAPLQFPWHAAVTLIFLKQHCTCFKIKENVQNSTTSTALLNVIKHIYARLFLHALQCKFPPPQTPPTKQRLFFFSPLLDWGSVLPCCSCFNYSFIFPNIFFIFLNLFCFLSFDIVLLLFFFHSFFFFPCHEACRILVPRLEVGPELLWWEL